MRRYHHVLTCSDQTNKLSPRLTSFGSITITAILQPFYSSRIANVIHSYKEVSWQSRILLSPNRVQSLKPCLTLPCLCRSSGSSAFRLPR